MIRCAVVGASGYTGAELAAILLRHPETEIVGMYGSAREGAARTFSELHPRFRGECDLPIQAAEAGTILGGSPDAVFLCTPHEASAALACDLIDAAPGGPPTTFDLSAAFRLPDPAAYESYYKFTHPRPALLRSAVYGLVELHRADLRTAGLVAVPGCYPTSVILPVAPLAGAGAISAGTRVVADCISGVSGAGRTPNERNVFCEVSVQPYGVWNHRHGPEITAHAGTEVIFTPHLGPYDRGIVSTLHLELAPGWTETRTREVLTSTYADAPFVRLLPAGSWPSVNGVRGTNYCDIALAERGGHLIVVSAIDNLIKGASGQAVQCMNVRFGLPEQTGLAPASEVRA
ncbi:MAG: N-acetyl-gamma-glutamyl-phosphate reductase [Phycisphaerales bacterium]|nr:N-acetyl-gamma-glutamyl-phosphate reductase [Phycisphaerales bacterium]